MQNIAQFAKRSDQRSFRWDIQVHTQTLVCVICVWWLDQVLAVSRIYQQNSQANFTCTGAIMHSYDWPRANEVTKND